MKKATNKQISLMKGLITKVLSLKSKYPILNQYSNITTDIYNVYDMNSSEASLSIKVLFKEISFLNERRILMNL